MCREGTVGLVQEILRSEKRVCCLLRFLSRKVFRVLGVSLFFGAHQILLVVVLVHASCLSLSPMLRLLGVRPGRNTRCICFFFDRPHTDARTNVARARGSRAFRCVVCLALLGKPRKPVAGSTRFRQDGVGVCFWLKYMVRTPFSWLSRVVLMLVPAPVIQPAEKQADRHTLRTREIEMERERERKTESVFF